MTDTKRPCSHYLLGESVDGVDYCTCGFAYAAHDVPARRAVFTLAEHRPPVKPRWDPLTLLKALVADVESGKVVPDHLLVGFTETQPDGSKVPRTWSSGITYTEAIAFGVLWTQRSLEDWRR